MTVKNKDKYLSRVFELSPTFRKADPMIALRYQGSKKKPTKGAFGNKNKKKRNNT